MPRLHRTRADRDAAAPILETLENKKPTKEKPNTRLTEVLAQMRSAGFVKDAVDASVLKSQLRSIKNGAAVRELAYDLPDELVFELIQQPCGYCGLIEPHRYNGLDRIDNKVGYIESNVVTCCRWCNFAKGDMSFEEFASHIERLSTHLRKLRGGESAA